MKIAVDLEGTLADIHTPWIKLHNAGHGTNYTLKDMTGWDFFFGSSTEDFFRDVKNLWLYSWREIPPTEKNIGEKLSVLSDAHIIEIVTKSVAAAAPKGTECIIAWQHAHKIPYHSVFLEHGSKFELNYDLYVDDSPKFAEQAKIYRKKVLLYDRPWNQSVKDNAYVKRIYSLSEISDHLEHKN
jgi:5'(3')-deoxyribonucleotidase